mmetsp:Transcript_12962/g.17063  ORF Transcript_12962/g.17063 Transcript_12962/m.17063 type:complete len:624 (-) Transcript_12962:271-2142(-)
MDLGKNIGNIVRKAKGEGKSLPAEFMSPDVPKSSNKEKLRRFGEWSMIKLGLSPSIEDYEYDENVGNLEDFIDRYRETRKALQDLQKAIDAELQAQKKLWELRQTSTLFQTQHEGEFRDQVHLAVADPALHGLLSQFTEEMVSNVLAAAWGVSKAIDQERKLRKDLIIDYQMRAREYQEAQDEMGWHYMDKMEATRRTKARRATLIKVIKQLRSVTLDLKRKFQAFEDLQGQMRDHLVKVLAVSASVEAAEVLRRLQTPPVQEDETTEKFKEMLSTCCQNSTTNLKGSHKEVDVPVPPINFEISGQELVEQLMKDSLSKIKIQTWECPKCTIHNEFQASKCTACGTTQEAALKALETNCEDDKTGTWSCAACTLDNPLCAALCAACGQQQENIDDVAPPLPSMEPPGAVSSLADSTPLPPVLVECIRYLDPRDLSAPNLLTGEGIFKTDGNPEEIEKLKLLFTTTDTPPLQIPEGTCPHDVVGLFSQCFRELADSIFSKDQTAHLVSWVQEGGESGSVFQQKAANLVAQLDVLPMKYAVVGVAIVLRALQETPSSTLTRDEAAAFLDGILFGGFDTSSLEKYGVDNKKDFKTQCVCIQFLEGADIIFDEMWEIYPGKSNVSSS